MSTPFSKEFQVRWADVDMNRHMMHSVFYEYAAHMRVCYMEQNGFDIGKLAAMGIGPILLKESCSFIKEIHIMENITYNVKRGPITPDSSRWTMYHEVFNGKGEKAAQIEVKGAWMDLRARKLTTPPVELAEAFLALVEGEEFDYAKSKSE